MRKIAFLLSLMLGLGFAACEKQDIAPVEPVFPSPEAVVVDDDACGKGKIALLFDGTAAIKAGAESFTATLTPTEETEGAAIALTRKVSHSKACNPVFENVPNGVYTASVFATYPNEIVTEPVFVKDSEGNIVKLQIGGGTVTVKLAYATSSTLAFTWSVSRFEDPAKDRNTAYDFGIYKDAACKELIVSWKTNANASIWTGDLADGHPQFEFSGLDQNTSYWIVVNDTTNGAKSAVVEGKTLPFEVVVPDAAKPVEANGIALAEDFSELVWGANYLRGSAAYSADDRNLATAFDKATGVNPVNGGPWKWYLVDPTVEIGLFSTMKHAVENSRLAQWGSCNEIAGGSNTSVCGRVGHLKIGASNKVSLMCTPALVNLKSVATIELSFDQALYGTDPTTAGIFVFTESNHADKSGIYEVTPSFTNLTPTAEFELTAGRNFKSETFVIKNVHPGSRIGIGPIRKDGSAPGSSQHRMFLDNVVVKVVSYETIKVELAKPVITSALGSETEITVKWNAVENASGYVLEYKESSENNYTAIELGNVLEHTIKNLKATTSYQVRLKAVESMSQSESEYSDVAEVATVAKATFPMVANNADEFIAILANGGIRTASPTDEIQIKGNLDFAGKTLPAEAVFPGVLVGNNAVLSNINSDHALFALVGSAKDLTIDESCSFNATAVAPLAALAGEANGAITNVVNKANVALTLTAEANNTVTVAGIVAIANGALENCKNYGAVSYTNTAASYGGLIAGVAAYGNGALTKCENHGKVTLSIPSISNFGIVKGVENVPFHIGGLAAQLTASAPVTESVNNGEVDYNITKIENLGVSCGTNLPRMGGLVGLTQSSIANSTNNGKVNVNVKTSDLSIYTTKHYPIYVGGISGGAPNDATGATGADITDCVNNGEITSVTYCRGSIVPATGGIVGWPGFLDPSQTNLITRCQNTAVINATTFAIARVGGISGGSGNVTHCKNTGNINGSLSIEDGNIGGIIGWLDKGHKFEYNECYAKLTNLRAPGTSGTSEIGGLIGQHGNYDSCPGEGRGCIVNCDITYDYTNEKWYGMLLGYYWDTAHTVVLGTPEEPIKVLGGSMTYSGGTTQVTAENYTQYTNHSSAGGKSGSKPFTVHVKFGN